MKWQDAVLAAGSILFIVALLPTLWSKEKPPRFTSYMTGGVLAAFAFVYGTLGLTFACITTGVTAVQWGIIGAQVSLRQQPKSAKLHEFPNSGD